ncbi:tetratricopeptide repeat protein [Dactylosporangium sp. NPDC048998]|uniref:tetratricopeptide repeat protein n=1 Tax=Dactylosporangium sp. NPDC048998 TaxID=3363976 RepID=UPI003719D74B
MRAWLAAVLAGAGALLAAALSVATNIATGHIPAWLSWADKAAVAWPATVVLVIVVVGVAVLLQRLAGSDDAATDVGLGLRVFGSVPRAAAHFQQRREEMAAVRTAMGGRSRAALVALPGLRGAGKSQLAAAYARDCADQGFDLVAWVNAESGPVADLALLARHLGLGDATEVPEVLAAMVVTWLQNQERGRRLLVFDNVDDPDTVTPFIPRAGRAKVLVTTNRSDFADAAGFTWVSVGMFSPMQGLAFLQAMTGLPAGPDAQRLGVELGWLPLGLAQAGAYIARSRYSYRRYLEVLDGQDLDETLRRRAGTDHPGVLKATALSVAGLSREDPSGDAARLLGVLALLSPDGVSRYLLDRGRSALGLTGGLAAALDVLVGASLVTLSGTGEDAQGRDAAVVVVHRLTGRTIRHLYSRPDATAPLADAVNAATDLIDRLTDDLPFTGLAHRRSELDELVGHVTALRGHVTVPDERLLEQIGWAGTVLLEVGDLTRGLPLIESAANSWIAICGPDHPGTLRTRNNLAGAYESAGRLDEAITLYDQVLADRLRVLGPDHPHTLSTRNNLAGAYQSAGRLDEAITLYNQVLAHNMRVLGPNHPHTLTTRNNLAYAYESAGQPDEAITLYDQVLADRLRVLGPNHPHTLITRNNLAGAYQSAGRPDEAITLFNQVLADAVRVLGPDHPHTLITRNNLASAYQSAGRPDEAITLFNQVLADNVRVLGPDHPHTLITRHNIAGAYQSAGRPDKAITLLNQVLADNVRVLGPDHPDTLAIRHNLASAYQSAGRPDKAITLFNQVLADNVRVLGPDHPDTLITRNNLASAYESAGRLEDAITLYDQVLADRLRVLGPDHPHTLTTSHNLAAAVRLKARA